MRRLGDERGQTSVELLAMLPLLFFIGLCIWQVHLTLSVLNDAENAARTAARKAGGVEAVRAALQPEHRDNLVRCRPGEGNCTTAGGGSAHVVVRVPVIVPIGDLGFKVEADAHMPAGGF